MGIGDLKNMPFFFGLLSTIDTHFLYRPVMTKTELGVWSLWNHKWRNLINFRHTTFPPQNDDVCILFLNLLFKKTKSHDAQLKDASQYNYLKTKITTMVWSRLLFEFFFFFFFFNNLGESELTENLQRLSYLCTLSLVRTYCTYSRYSMSIKLVIFCALTRCQRY